MRLDWMLLANHAEINNGLVYINGGSWDTTTVNAPLVGAPEGVVALFQGSLACRVLFHVTETGREHFFTISVMDEDGAQVARVEGRVDVTSPDVPPGWDQGVLFAVPLTGVQLSRFGLYRISLQVNGQHLGDQPFRV